MDVGKDEILGCLRWPNAEFERPWNIGNPHQIADLLELLKMLKSNCRSLTVGMEPTGTYGEAVRGRADHRRHRGASDQRQGQQRLPGNLRRRAQPARRQGRRRDRRVDRLRQGNPLALAGGQRKPGCASSTKLPPGNTGSSSLLEWFPQPGRPLGCLRPFCRTESDRFFRAMQLPMNVDQRRGTRILPLRIAQPRT